MTTYSNLKLIVNKIENFIVACGLNLVGQRPVFRVVSCAYRRKNSLEPCYHPDPRGFIFGKHQERRLDFLNTREGLEDCHIPALRPFTKQLPPQVTSQHRWGGVVEDQGGWQPQPGGRR